MDDRQIHSGPGKTAPRLIQDLLDYDPRNTTNWNILADIPPIFREGQIHYVRDEQSCRHSLCMKDNQSRVPVSRDDHPDGNTVYVISAYCSRCRFHFRISVDHRPTKGEQGPCHLSDEGNPLHHFKLLGSKDGEQYVQKHLSNKYDLCVEAHTFRCTNSACPVVVEIKISQPRLSNTILQPVLNADDVRNRGTREMEKDPERYDGQNPVTPALAIGYLRKYLSDAKSTMATGEIKKIARRNKKFMLAFADECDDLYRYLDFEPVEVLDPEGEETLYFWQLPTVASHNQDFIDDVVHELDILLLERPASEGDEVNKARLALQRVPALKYIERSLACSDYPTRSRLIDMTTEEHPHYRSLGAVGNFTDKFLEWAYDRQCQRDPSNKAYYLDCLSGIATGRESSDLQMRVVMATSAGEHGLQAIENSYKFFGLTLEAVEGDDHIIGLYKSRIASALRQKDEARECLAIIAKHRKSDKIEELVNDRTISFEEALEFLQVSHDTGSDSIEASAVAISVDGDKSRVAKALQVIANKRGGDFVLSRAAAQMEAGSTGSCLNVSDAYARLQVTNRAVPDETVFAYFHSLSSGAAPGSKDSFTEALRVIALERQSAFLLRKLDDPNADLPSSTAEPIGLDNIGNTCYLNSLLQYYYTIKPVRNMVINFEDYKMPMTEENIKNKRVGGRIVAKSEIVKAQKFVAELHNLFENLKTASSRSVKPTRELAELTIFSSLTEANFRRASVSSPSGPPNIDSIMSMGGSSFGPQWPEREASRSSSMTAEDDIEMVDRPGEKQNEAADDSSEATLVDIDQLPPSYEEGMSTQVGQQHILEEKAAQVVNPADLDDDVVMVNGTTSSSETSPQTMPAPEKPPPIPPRNKPGLLISTSDSKSLIPDDDLWRFGTQQDVTEVIGNVTFRMQCAIKPTHIEEGSGEQIDVIRDTFFGSSTTYTQKPQSLERKVEAWPTIIIYPGKGVVRDIYEAIDVVFDEQKVEVDDMVCPQYSCISKLPPVLQIQIQRTDYDKDSQRSSKNRTAVTFPETIYLDRYVDDEGPNSATMKRRRETWIWKDKLRALTARQEELESNRSSSNVPEALLAMKDVVDIFQEDEIDGLGVGIATAIPDSLEQRLSEVASELDQLGEEINTLKQYLRDQFTDLRQYEYKLHSVFIHRGEAGGGHYWVYIYDFAHDIWREYNDEYVTEVQDRRRIFDQQGGFAGGTPYYLVYVRSSDQQDLVDAVCRDVAQAQEVRMVAESHDDMDMTLSRASQADDREVQHIEHANPKPLRPRPSVSKAIEWDNGAWEGENW